MLAIEGYTLVYAEEQYKLDVKLRHLWLFQHVQVDFGRFSYNFAFIIGELSTALVHYYWIH